MSDNAGSRNIGTVDQLLLEAELDDDGALRPVLLELRALGAGQPEPSAAVAALMGRAAAPLAAAPSLTSQNTAAATEAAPVSAPDPETAPAGASGSGKVPDELAARRRAKRRIALTTLSVAVSLAAGGAVAAASDQGIRDSIGQLNHAVTSFVSTVGGGPATKPAESPAPVPAQPDAPAPVQETGQTAPAPATAVPEAETTHGSERHPVPGPSASVTLPELPAADNLPPGVPAAPLHGEGKTPDLPLPATPPVPLPSHGP